MAHDVCSSSNSEPPLVVKKDFEGVNMQTREDLGPWDRRLLARLHALTPAQQAAIMQTVELLAARNHAPRRARASATIIPLRKKA